MVTFFPYHGKVEELIVWVDTDFAGCVTTRKSTNGGLTMCGKHALKGWSATQAVIALSSGEAEYDGIVKGAGIGIGVRSMLGDIRIKVKVVVNTDSIAAKGTASRRGLGRLMHMEVNQV